MHHASPRTLPHEAATESSADPAYTARAAPDECGVFDHPLLFSFSIPECGVGENGAQADVRPRYGYVGIPGASAEEALLRHFPFAINPVSLPSLSALVGAIAAGEIEGGILPVEDSLAGPAHDVLDVLETTELVQAEKFSFSTQQYLLALPGQVLHEVRQVLAQQEILFAHAGWLSDLGIELLSVTDAASAAKHISEQRLAGVAVIGSQRAAEVYHLAVLKRMRPNSLTRYVLLQGDPARCGQMISLPDVGGAQLSAGPVPAESLVPGLGHWSPALPAFPASLTSAVNGGYPASVVHLAVPPSPSGAISCPGEVEHRSLASSVVLDTSIAHALRHPSLKRERLGELLLGVRAALPVAASLVPFLLVYGVLAHAVGLSLLETMALAVLVFSGAQLVAAQMLLAGAPGVLIFAAGATMNARHLIYSAQLAPYLRRLSLPWRLVLAYLLTDELWALSLHHYRQARALRFQHWFGLGAGFLIWLAAQGATLGGGLLGGQMPASWHLELAAPFTFISLLILSRPGRAGVCAALAAGLAAWGASPLPLGLGLMIATGVGMVVGLGVERLEMVRWEGR